MCYILKKILILKWRGSKWTLLEWYTNETLEMIQQVTAHRLEMGYKQQWVMWMKERILRNVAGHGEWHRAVSGGVTWDIVLENRFWRIMVLECHQGGCSGPEGMSLLADLQEHGSTELICGIQWLFTIRMKPIYALKGQVYFCSPLGSAAPVFSFLQANAGIISEIRPPSLISMFLPIRHCSLSLPHF